MIHVYINACHFRVAESKESHVFSNSGDLQMPVRPDPCPRADFLSTRYIWS